MGDKYTRTFKNFHYNEIADEHFAGPRTMIDNRYKLVLDTKANKNSSIELFDMQTDPGENINLATKFPNKVDSMQLQLKYWQQSVLESLKGSDY